MNTIKKVLVIGATGRLGTPVAEELAKHFRVRAMVRTPDKAKAKLPPNVELVKGDLQDMTSLRAAVAGMDAIYLNLSTETADLNQPFYEEREGVKNLMLALQGTSVRYIAKIGALGAYPPALKTLKGNMVPNLIRMQGHQAITESGIAHTFFAPTHFMELLPNMINKNAIQWIGNTGITIYWISVVDYARQVVRAFQNPEQMPEHCPVQGPDGITVRQALERFVKAYDPSLKIRVAPLWVLKLIGIFNPKMRFVAHLFAYFGSHEDPFYADPTWKLLGRPTTTLESFAKDLRSRVCAT